MTNAERALWQALRCEQLQGFKFRRQAAIGNYVVDFVCFEEKLVIELDGGQHNEVETRRYDEARTRWLEAQGFRVLRYWNHDVLDDVDAVIDAVWIAMGKPVRGAPPSPNPSPPGGGGSPKQA